MSDQFTKPELDKFAPADLKLRIKTKPLNSLVIKYEKGEGAPIVQEVILLDVPKQQFRNRWIDATTVLEEVLLSKSGPFKVWFEEPQDYRGIYMIKAWKE